MLDNSSLHRISHTNLTRAIFVLIALLNRFAGPAAAQRSDLQSANDVDVFYKCYQQPSGDDGRETCYGRRCISTTHVNTGSRRLWCRNESDLEEGSGHHHRRRLTFDDGCVTHAKDDSLPGQSELVCSCTGDYCNAATRGAGVWQLALLAGASLTVAAVGARLCPCA